VELGGGWRAVCRLEDLRDRVPQQFQVASDALVLVRVGERVHAVSASCPHKYSPLSDGAVVGYSLQCAVHGAIFDLATGRPQAGEEWAGLLPLYPVRVRDGVVEVQL
jgi:nitrite reductase/ring-hydroxylating ferredoxin subunit